MLTLTDTNLSVVVSSIVIAIHLSILSEIIECKPLEWLGGLNSYPLDCNFGIPGPFGHGN